jgi:hypothetical protein
MFPTQGQKKGAFKHKKGQNTPAAEGKSASAGFGPGHLAAGSRPRAAVSEVCFRTQALEGEQSDQAVTENILPRKPDLAKVFLSQRLDLFQKY